MSEIGKSMNSSLHNKIAVVKYLKTLIQLYITQPRMNTTPRTSHSFMAEELQFLFLLPLQSMQQIVAAFITRLSMLWHYLLFSFLFLYFLFFFFHFAFSPRNNSYLSKLHLTYL